MAPGGSGERREIRSYVLRQGRLTRGQQHAIENNWAAFGVDFSHQQIDFAGIFGNEAGVVVEIGFGNGESLVEQAEQHPDTNYFGIEVHRPGVGHCLHLVEQKGMQNLRVSNHDAVEVLREQVADHSVVAVQLFFPDPWQKKRHHKRRILQPGFIALVHSKLVNGGVFHLATDWEDYAEHMQREMAASPLFQLESTERGERPLTKFEQRGVRLGHQVWDFVYRAVEENPG